MYFRKLLNTWLLLVKIFVIFVVIWNIDRFV